MTPFGADPAAINAVNPLLAHAFKSHDPRSREIPPFNLSVWHRFYAGLLGHAFIACVISARSSIRVVYRCFSGWRAEFHVAFSVAFSIRLAAPMAFAYQRPNARRLAPTLAGDARSVSGSVSPFPLRRFSCAGDQGVNARLGHIDPTIAP
jgi:hypothetical protein